MASRILGGLLIVAAGSGIVVYTEAILETFGSMNWAERLMPFYGGSRFAYKLIGIFFVIIGFMMITGMLGNVLWALLGGLFTGFRTLPPPQ